MERMEQVLRERKMRPPEDQILDAFEMKEEIRPKELENAPAFKERLRQTLKGFVSNAMHLDSRISNHDQESREHDMVEKLVEGLNMHDGFDVSGLTVAITRDWYDGYPRLKVSRQGIQTWCNLLDGTIHGTNEASKKLHGGAQLDLL